MLSFKSSRLHMPLAVVLLSSMALPSLADTKHLDAHEHGVSTLKIAQEGNIISLELEAPGDDIVGFEHAAKNDADKNAIKDAFHKLANPNGLFMMPEAANCTTLSQSLSFASEGEHAGFEVEWKVSCENIAKATQMNVNFFKAFPRAHEVEVQGVGNKGQAAIEVEHEDTTVDLSGFIGE